MVFQVLTRSANNLKTILEYTSNLSTIEALFQLPENNIYFNNVNRLNSHDNTYIDFIFKFLKNLVVNKLTRN